jgi:hypothetical protein
MKEEEIEKGIHEKFDLGDPLSDDEVVYLASFYSALVRMLRLLSPMFDLALHEAIGRLERIEGMRRFRNDAKWVDTRSRGWDEAHDDCD